MSRCSCLPVHPARGVHYLPVGFPGGSDGEESICNAGDPGSIPGSGRSPGEGIGCLLQNAWASLVAQLVKNPPAVRETWVRKIPLEKGTTTHSSILAWRIPWTIYSMESQRVGHNWVTLTSLYTVLKIHWTAETTQKRKTFLPATHPEKNLQCFLEGNGMALAKQILCGNY